MGNDNDVKGKQGKFQCFVAYDLDAESRAQYNAQGRGTPGANVPHFFQFLLAEPLRVRPVLAQSSRADDCLGPEILSGIICET